MHVLLSAAAHVMATEGTGIGKPQHLQKVHKKKQLPQTRIIIGKIVYLAS